MNGSTFLPDATYALQTVLAVSILIGLVLAARRPVARHFGAGVAYALWALPLARLILPPLQMPVSLMPFVRLSKPAATVSTEASSTTTIMAVSDTAAPALAAMPHAPVPPVASTSFFEGLPSSSPLTDSLSAMLLPPLFTVWIGGALLAFGLSMWRQHVFMQTVKREAVNVSPRLQRIAQQVAHQVGLKRLPVIASSFISSGPLVTGLARPVVLLPAWFETDYDDTQQRAALAHELTHVRRGDLWALQAAEFFIACMWFNPLAYYAHRAFRTDQEAACDADVLKAGTASPHAYGATLIKAVKSASQERLPAAAGLPLTHALKERLSRMTHPTPSKTARLAGGAAAAILGAAALIATSSVSANAGEREHRELRIDNGTVYLNGERIKDRQIVILGEPFAGIEPGPEFNAEIERLSKEMAEEGTRISQIVTAKVTANVPEPSLSPEDDPEFQALMEELNNLPLVMEFKSGSMVSADSEMTDEEWEAWGQKWEEWGERFEQRASAFEARAKAYEARAGAMHRDMDPEQEKMTHELEAGLEAKAAKLEILIQEQYGDNFEARFSATSDALDGLVEECRDANLAEGETRVLTRTVNLDQGERTVKIACVKGGESALRSAKAVAVIKSSKALGDDEKADFLRQVGPEGELDGADK
jgi:beta-lactamase regulating signal transducer with metallopeptidase domain